MPEVIVEGIFLGSEMKSKTFNGETKNHIQVDVYQPESKDGDKNISIKVVDLTLDNKIKQLKMGSPIRAKVSINAYQNTAYYRMLELA